MDARLKAGRRLDDLHGSNLPPGGCCVVGRAPHSGSVVRRALTRSRNRAPARGAAGGRGGGGARGGGGRGARDGWVSLGGQCGTATAGAVFLRGSRASPGPRTRSVRIRNPVPVS